MEVKEQRKIYRYPRVVGDERYWIFLLLFLVYSGLKRCSARSAELSDGRDGVMWCGVGLR